jgi:hypothetical protein
VRALERAGFIQLRQVGSHVTLEEYMGISRQTAMAYVDEEAGGDEAFELSAS